ncbi:pyridoxal phosphate-dependent aminotransferase [Niabella sp. 22666]|uniref:pyridoxal phosphate-dependent aminotransferase n=1 Tax=Niabella sp. 22666 TaxID=3453954 RepID=UPI003F837688
MKLSQLAETMPAPAPLAIGNAIRERINKGEQIYNLTIGDFLPSLFPIPQLLEDAIIEAYQNKQTNYPAPEGNADLREQLSAFIRHFQNLYYAPAEILVASGGRPLIFAAYQTIVDKGDKVIYPVPSWNNHYYVQLSGAQGCAIETSVDNNFMLTAEDIRPHLKDAVLLALCSPQNPTGTCYTQEQMKAIGDMIVEENSRRGDGEKKLYVLYDHIYNLLVQDSAQHVDPVSVCSAMKDYTIFTDAVSKNFAATGVRVGWGYGPQQIINKMKTILSHVGAWAPMAEQKALAVFFNDLPGVEEYLHNFKRKIARRLDGFYDGLMALRQEGLPVEIIAPQASIYLTVKIDIPGDIFNELLNEGIAVIPFSAFGAKKADQWFRLSVGTCKLEDIAAILQRFRKVLMQKIEMAH